ncbi:hypothetical protein ACOSP7_003381 [Xanthoceras sorbifolium]
MMDSFPDLYPLTSLQIGDVKSYLSQAFLYFAPISHKFFILVDNQSWWKNKLSASACIRELMITKYRRSPFRNGRTLLRCPSFGYKSSSHENKKLSKWLPILNLASFREKTPFSKMDLYKALHGFIVFEVVWKDVRGINYLNELQKDASFTLEVKALRKWEFNGIEQAFSCMTSWFSGTQSETQTLKRNLVLLHDRVPLHSSRGITVGSKELLLKDESQAELYLEDIYFDVRECPIDTNGKLNMDHQLRESICRKEQYIEKDSDIKPMEYSDTFLLFRFNDRDLPFKLRQIITSDLKLLTLLEAGLPSWVIFLQSYPLLSKVYSPWMPPLWRTLYILISLVTVVIGFYDLYKHVPLLKAAMSHVFGPLFKWVEAWDGISRIRYLGTMLFLQNLEKAIEWFLMVMRVMKLPVSLLMIPLTPMWDFFTEIGEQFYITTSVLVEPLCSMILDFVEVLFSPLELLYSYILNLVTMICPLFSSMWELVLFPTRGFLLLANYVASFFGICGKTLMTIVSSTNHFSDLTQFKPDSSQISLWHSIWKDLFSKVFKSVRNIVRGLFTFFTSCNRHRHSIYSLLRATLLWLCCVLRLASPTCPCRQVPQVESPLKAGIRQCARCK